MNIFIFRTGILHAIHNMLQISWYTMCSLPYCVWSTLWLYMGQLNVLYGRSEYSSYQNSSVDWVALYLKQNPTEGPFQDFHTVWLTFDDDR